MQNQNYNYWARLKLLYILSWKISAFRRGVPIPAAFTNVCAGFMVWIGLVAISPLILVVYVLKYLLVPFYPAWKAIRLSAAGASKIEGWLNAEPME